MNVHTYDLENVVRTLTEALTLKCAALIQTGTKARSPLQGARWEAVSEREALQDEIASIQRTINAMNAEIETRQTRYFISRFSEIDSGIEFVQVIEAATDAVMAREIVNDEYTVLQRYFGYLVQTGQMFNTAEYNDMLDKAAQQEADDDARADAANW